MGIMKGDINTNFVKKFFKLDILKLIAIRLPFSANIKLVTFEN